ncbi:hypothetical protein [Pelosinus sp. IPA-1]|uniref:hypothetical protein n=1 Tax=Pelosinus sp. IPA-1 TaxID=3029569 RepID=UPI0024361809|nr:hypothetical protein [Pelosinus sp. IPA-1]GMB01431.1 hypothetical protein PIPA1_42300 [Pelosinus sp. IPA-1]
MKEETLNKLLTTMENIDRRLHNLEELTSGELKKIHATIDHLATDNQDDLIITLQHIDAKVTAILETQKLNFEILKVFSGDPIQH